MVMSWCHDGWEFAVLCTAPNDKDVVALAGAFQLSYEDERLSLIHAYVHYIDAYNKRADAWVRVEVYDAGLAVKGAEPFGEQIEYSLVSECWDGEWEIWEDALPVSLDDQTIFENLGAALMRLCIEDEEDGSFMVPTQELQAELRPAYIFGHDGETVCHTGRFNRELLLGAVSRSLPRNETFFDLPWDLDAARNPLPRVAESQPPSYRFLLRFQASDCPENTAPRDWFEAFSKTCALEPVNAVLDSEADVILAAALGPWSIFEMDSLFTKGSRTLEEELQVVDLSHGRCQYYFSGRLADSEPLDILSTLDEEALSSYETNYASLTP